MKPLINKIGSGIVGAVSLVGALIAHAQIQPGTGQIPVYTSSGIQDVTALGTRFTVGIQYFATFVIAISVIMLLWAGFKFITAGDNEEEVGKARKMITYGIVGLVVAFLAFSLPVIIRQFIT